MLPLFALLVLAPACHAEASIKASTNDSRDDDGTATTAAPPPAEPAPTSGAPAAAAAAAPASPPADACPLTCFEARGSERVNVTNEELTQLRSALEPVIGRMRGCSSAEEWRRSGSAVVNLRIAPDGTLAELGVDPHHGRESQCFDDAGRGASASLSLPGRKVVRCAERCVHEAPKRGGGRRGRGR
jgi:hypothetical protein